MYEKVTVISGIESGPVSIILAGVHGDEKCGVAAFSEILPDLKINKGEVIFAYGNPIAIKENKRFVEANLNRMFKSENVLKEEEKKSYEYKRAQSLKEIMKKADVLLDIHSSFTPQSTPFVICEPNAIDIVKFLPFQKIVYGFDAVEPGGTDYYMNSINKVGICIECGSHNDPSSIKIAKDSIFAFLTARGHINGKLISKDQSILQTYLLYNTKTDKFILLKKFSDFEVVKAGETIGYDGDEKVIAQKESLILFARNRDKKGDEAFLLAENKNGYA